jgi:hypothetical protein
VAKRGHAKLFQIVARQLGLDVQNRSRSGGTLARSAPARVRVARPQSPSYCSGACPWLMVRAKSNRREPMIQARRRHRTNVAKGAIPLKKSAMPPLRCTSGARSRAAMSARCASSFRLSARGSFPATLHLRAFRAAASPERETFFVRNTSRNVVTVLIKYLVSIRWAARRGLPTCRTLRTGGDGEGTLLQMKKPEGFCGSRTRRTGADTASYYIQGEFTELTERLTAQRCKHYRRRCRL